MQATKIFRNGNSQAVRIPADLAFEATDLDYQIERVGDELRIRPMPQRIQHALAALLQEIPALACDAQAAAAVA